MGQQDVTQLTEPLATTESSGAGAQPGTLQLVERHIIDRNDPRWAALDAACFLSKNLYNAALYRLRQHFFATGKSLGYSVLAHDMLADPDYCGLPRKVCS